MIIWYVLLAVAAAAIIFSSIICLLAGADKEAPAEWMEDFQKVYDEIESDGVKK